MHEQKKPLAPWWCCLVTKSVSGREIRRQPRVAKSEDNRASRNQKRTEHPAHRAPCKPRAHRDRAQFDETSASGPIREQLPYKARSQLPGRRLVRPISRVLRISRLLCPHFCSIFCSWARRFRVLQCTLWAAEGERCSVANCCLLTRHLNASKRFRTLQNASKRFQTLNASERAYTSLPRIVPKNVRNAFILTLASAKGKNWKLCLQLTSFPSVFVNIKTN